MTETEYHGPIDFLIIQFPVGTDGRATVQAISDLIDRGIVRLYDLMVVARGADGSATEIDLDSSSDERLAALRSLQGARSGLLGASDVDDAASVLDDDTVALVLLYENAWAVPFVAAALGDGGQVVASSRLTAQEIADALDAADAAG